MSFGKYVYFVVTCDFADSGVLAALMILTLFCWHTQHKSNIGSWWLCGVPTIARERWRWYRQLLWYQPRWMPTCTQSTLPGNVKYLQECIHMHSYVFACVCEMSLCVCAHVWDCTVYMRDGNLCVCMCLRAWDVICVCACMRVWDYTVYVRWQSVYVCVRACVKWQSVCVHVHM